MTFALDLAKRNGGYLAACDDPAIVELQRAGLVTTQDIGDGYLIARVIHFERYNPYRNARGRRAPRVVEIAAVIA